MRTTFLREIAGTGFLWSCFIASVVQGWGVDKIFFLGAIGTSFLLFLTIRERKVTDKEGS